MGDGLPKWHFDRQRRVKLFEQLKKYQPGRKPKKPDPSEKTDRTGRPKKRYDWIIPLLGAILKIIAFLAIFYSFAMILSHGKYWPE
ncbi:MAG: hypothetical protein GC178_07315 [Flavobacteriales bacterium]|nr:hypothetical protein [Flavobacteriales bacterium]